MLFWTFLLQNYHAAIVTSDMNLWATAQPGLEHVLDSGRDSSRQSTAAQLGDGAMEAEEGSIRWGENLRLAGRKNVSICASDP